MILRYCVEGSDQALQVRGELRIGRGADNDLVLPDFSVSRRHAIIRRHGGDWVVEDLGSTNGVEVNGERTETSPLQIGDHLRIGVFELAVEADQPGLISGLAAAHVPNATIVRSLAEFNVGFELAPEPGGEQRNTAFLGYLTRLGRELIRTDSVDEVLQHVIDIAFEALPVDRGFIMLGEPETATCELARVGDRVEVRPAGSVPVSKTILDTVMRHQVALLTLDALDDQRLVGGDSIRIHGIRAAMCAPLWADERISGFIQLDTPFQTGTFSDSDLDFLIALANYAAIGVERVRERNMRGRLERYHSPAIVEEVLRHANQAGNQETAIRVAEVTVLFADMVGFTAYSETATPEQVAELLRGYCTRAVNAIFEHGGTLDKFIGDCVMAFFGAPVPQADHALCGVSAAIAIQQAVGEWNRERLAQDLPEVRCRVALNSGLAVVGDVGSETRVDYTVLGNTVNVASRLESTVAKPGEIVIGESTRALAGDGIECEPLGEFALKNLARKIHAYRVLGSRGGSAA